MTLAEKLALVRTSMHGTLYRLERSYRELCDFPGSAQAKRKVTLEWEYVMTRTLADLEAQAEEFDDDEIREAIAFTRRMTGYPKCPIPLGRML